MLGAILVVAIGTWVNWYLMWFGTIVIGVFGDVCKAIPTRPTRWVSREINGFSDSAFEFVCETPARKRIIGGLISVMFLLLLVATGAMKPAPPLPHQTHVPQVAPFDPTS